jgi:hypothetical protein
MPGSAGVCANLSAWEKGVKQACAKEMAVYGNKCVSYIHSTHRWEDQTGQASAGIGTQTFKQGEGIITDVFHSVEHGVYLELREDFAGRYKILEESIQHDITGLISRLRIIVTSSGFVFSGVSFGGGARFL